MADMRAKMCITNVHEGNNYEILSFNAVSKSEAYPEDGSDENNTYALWTPQASINITINNPALHGKFKIGEEYYVDFTKAKGK